MTPLISYVRIPERLVTIHQPDLGPLQNYWLNRAGLSLEQQLRVAGGHLCALAKVGTRDVRLSLPPPFCTAKFFSVPTRLKR